MKCQNCKSTKVNQKRFDHDFYTHFNYTKITDFNIFIECEVCKIIYSKRSSFLNKIYKSIFSKKYEKNRVHKLVAKFDNIQIYKHFINKEIKKRSNLNILDYGNRSDEQLKEYSNLFYQSKIIFYDISIKKNYFYYNKKTKTECILTDKLSDINGKFDLIILFNTLQYYIKFKSFFSLIKRISHHKTKMYVITPSIEINKYFLLLGDEYFKFTKVGLYNFLVENLCKKVKILKRDYLTNANFVMVDFSKKSILKKVNKPSVLDQFSSFFDKQILKIKKINKKKIYVFGTRVNSCFVTKYLKNFKGLVDDQSNYTHSDYQLLNKISDKDTPILIPYVGLKLKMIKKILIKKKFKNYLTL